MPANVHVAAFTVGLFAFAAYNLYAAFVPYMDALKAAFVIVH